MTVCIINITDEDLHNYTDDEIELAKLYCAKVRAHVDPDVLDAVNAANDINRARYPDGCLDEIEMHVGNLMLDAMTELFEFDPIQTPGWIEYYRDTAEQALLLASSKYFYLEG